MNIPKIIKLKRRLLNETQTQFGERFGVTHAAVSEWESGKSEAGYDVIYFVLSDFVVENCVACSGTGLNQLIKDRE